MRALRFIAQNARAMLLIVLVVVGLIIFAVASRTQDKDSAWCAWHRGEEVVDEYPHQPDVHRCIVNGEVVRAWKKVNGKNVLIQDSSVRW